jgi:hypothetical protein
MVLAVSGGCWFLPMMAKLQPPVRWDVPEAHMSIALPRSFVTLIHGVEFNATPINALAERFPRYRACLTSAIEYVTGGDWDLFAIDGSVDAMTARRGPMVQVWRWKFVDGLSVEELGQLLIEAREQDSDVEDAEHQAVALPIGDAVRTRYITPRGFLAEGRWVWIEYTVYVGDLAVGIGIQAPEDAEAEAARLIDEIVISIGSST